MINFTGSDLKNLNFKQEFCLKLVKNGKTKMIEKSVLLTENSAFENHLT